MQLDASLIPLIITFLLSSFYGVERQLSHKPIGFGTFTFVSTGSCALAMIAIRMGPSNPLPLLGAIVTGIGFLGAGALIKAGEKVAGFTSAALIWIFAVFGLAMGTGGYVIAGMTYIVIWVVIWYDRNLEKQGLGSYYRKITIITNRIIPEQEIRKALFGDRKHSLVDLRGDKEHDSLTIIYSIEGAQVHIDEILKILEQLEWCASYSIE
jgi:uncharacterized membrane protein YhiD involved in acid resistance